MATLQDPFPYNVPFDKALIEHATISFFWNPLIYLLERQLTGNKSGHRATKTAVVTHADDVTIFVAAPADIQIIGDLLLTY
jgi:hypothetical protein